MVRFALSGLLAAAVFAAVPCLAGVRTDASVPASDEVSHTSDTVVHHADGPVLVFGSGTIDLGVFSKNEIQEGSFVFTNGGNEPLALLQVFTDCGCTATTYSRTPVQPGDSSEIKVKFDGSGRNPGRFLKVIKIRSNAVNSLVRIYVTGIVKPR